MPCTERPQFEASLLEPSRLQQPGCRQDMANPNIGERRHPSHLHADRVWYKKYNHYSKWALSAMRGYPEVPTGGSFGNKWRLEDSGRPGKGTSLHRLPTYGSPCTAIRDSTNRVIEWSSIFTHVHLSVSVRGISWFIFNHSNHFLIIHNLPSWSCPINSSPLWRNFCVFNPLLHDHLRSHVISVCTNQFWNIPFRLIHHWFFHLKYPCFTTQYLKTSTIIPTWQLDNWNNFFQINVSWSNLSCKVSAFPT